MLSCVMFIALYINNVHINMPVLAQARSSHALWLTVVNKPSLDWAWKDWTSSIAIFKV